MAGKKHLSYNTCLLFNRKLFFTLRYTEAYKLKLARDT